MISYIQEFDHKLSIYYSLLLNLILRLFLPFATKFSNLWYHYFFFS